MSSARQRLTVLFLPHPTRPKLFTPWGEDVIAALGDHHKFRIFDKRQPLAPQFAGVDVVIDHGGGASTREMLQVAQSVRLWQVLGTGLDHFDLDYWRTHTMPVANTPGPFSAVALGECAMLLILMLARKIPVAQATLRRGELYDQWGWNWSGVRLASWALAPVAASWRGEQKPLACASP
jgi:lactate dehydrogenase-like 2-hydroxyacid dehydrogenase